MPPPAARNPVRDAITSIAVLSILAGVYFLDPDTSLKEVKASGLLRVCVPDSNAPLVTTSSDKPGIDVELLRLAAKDIGVELALSRVPAMAQDFNPRNWRITRAQCQALGGGVADSPLTRSFLDVIGSHGETGWAMVSKTPIADLARKRVAALPLGAGLDRLALTQALRAIGATAFLAPNEVALVSALNEGRADLAVTERMNAERIAAANGWIVAWVPGDLPRFRLTFGLWKGDLTLKRALAASFDRMARDGTQARILATYLGEPKRASAP